MRYLLTRDREELQAAFEVDAVQRAEAVCQLGECFPMDDIETFEEMSTVQLAAAVARTFDQGYEIEVPA